jgi:hypothetical protein
MASNQITNPTKGGPVLFAFWITFIAALAVILLFIVAIVGGYTITINPWRMTKNNSQAERQAIEAIVDEKLANLRLEATLENRFTLIQLRATLENRIMLAKPDLFKH